MFLKRSHQFLLTSCILTSNTLIAIPHMWYMGFHVKLALFRARPETRIRLSKPLKADLLVWRDFLWVYNDRTCCQEDEVTSGEVELFTDAAGLCGLGAIRLGCRTVVLRCLQYNIWFHACHVPRVENRVADALSPFSFAGAS